MDITPIRPLELMLDENLTKSNFDDFIGVWDSFMMDYHLILICQYDARCPKASFHHI